MFCVIDLAHGFHRIKHKIQRFVFGDILQTLLMKLRRRRHVFTEQGYRFLLN